MKLILIFLAVIFLFCCSSSGEKSAELQLINIIQLPFGEASGLTYDSESSSLLAVSDNENLLYQLFRLNLSGSIETEYNLCGYDLEAVAQKPEDNSIWVADERTARVFLADSAETGFILQQALDDNNGIEGIAFGDSVLYILKEKNPALLFSCTYEGMVIDSLNLSYAQDFTDLEYDRQNKRLFMLSEQSKKLMILNSRLELVKQYALDIDKPEGLAYQPEDNTLYIACDSTSKLYIYKLQ